MLVSISCLRVVTYLVNRILLVCRIGKASIATELKKRVVRHGESVSSWAGRRVRMGAIRASADILSTRFLARFYLVGQQKAPVQQIRPSLRSVDGDE